MVRLRSQPVNALHRLAGLANCRAGIPVRHPLPLDYGDDRSYRVNHGH